MSNKQYQWPFPALREDLRAAGQDTSKTDWREISEDAFDHFLNVLPPLRMRSYGHLCSEPYCDDLNCNPCYTACVSALVDSKTQYYAKLCTLSEFNQMKGFEPVYCEKVESSFLEQDSFFKRKYSAMFGSVNAIEIHLDGFISFFDFNGEKGKQAKTLTFSDKHKALSLTEKVCEICHKRHVTLDEFLELVQAINH